MLIGKLANNEHLLCRGNVVARSEQFELRRFGSKMLDQQIERSSQSETTAHATSSDSRRRTQLLVRSDGNDSNQGDDRCAHCQ